AAVRVRALGARVREPDAVREGALRGALQPDVDGEAQRVARGRRHHQPRTALLAPARVDRELLLAVAPAEIRVVGALDARLADHIARQVLLAQRLVLLRRDRADVAEDLRRQRL